jgi:hypothetical protein
MAQTSKLRQYAVALTHLPTPKRNTSGPLVSLITIYRSVPHAPFYFYCPSLKILGDFLCDFQYFMMLRVLSGCPIDTPWGIPNVKMAQLLNVSISEAFYLLMRKN